MYKVFMSKKPDFFTVSQVADILSVSKATVRRWDKSGKLVPARQKGNQYRLYSENQLKLFDEGKLFFRKSEKDNRIESARPYSLIELFAGAGGLALGLEKAGLKSVLVNEIDRDACKTLRENRPDWNVVESGIAGVDFSPYLGKIDILTGGFPCQAFSYAGKKLGFGDIRGTLFFEYARAVKECQPAMIVAENVRGLLRHEDGRTLQTMLSVIRELGYSPLEPRVLKALHYRVPQKRERLILVAFRNDLAGSVEFRWPSPEGKIYTLKDALKKGDLFPKNVPKSDGQKYPETKRAVLDQVPPGGYWRDLPVSVQKEYMMKSYYLGGGKTGMARRMSWDEPCPTLTCAPAQKQTERCHPDETRPFTTREYARIQTFPDEWKFCGSQTSVYKQIGNAVPVNLAEQLGYSLVDAMNQISISLDQVAKAV